MEGGVMVEIGDMVKSAKWRESPTRSHLIERVGLVVANDPKAESFVLVVWLPLPKGGQCRTFHAREALEKVS
jgi:hypothetical protein